MVTTLALDGGEPVVAKARSRVTWPVVTDDDRAAVLRVLDSGRFTSNTMGEVEVRGLEGEWAAYVGVEHCAAVANGTAAIALALGALGVQPGEEVIVPALTFVGSALGVLQALAVPVFADVDPHTFNLDPVSVEAAVSDRTRAILAVHLHGLPAPVDELAAIADRRGLALVEDAAQAHGASYRGRRTGSLGRIAAFSLNVTKNLPTCGEGGLVTTDDDELHERVVLLRQFGERVREDEPRAYTAVTGFNHKLGAVEAAFTRSQLARLDDYDRLRRVNVERFLSRLSVLPGLDVPRCPPDRTHAWHILRLRFHPGRAGFADVAPGPFRQMLHRTLRAEGVSLSQYQRVPLPALPSFQAREGHGDGHPWSLPGARPVRYDAEDFPNALAVLEDSLTLQKRHLVPDACWLLDRYADAFEKVWSRLDRLASAAQRLRYVPAWQQAKTADR